MCCNLCLLKSFTPEKKEALYVSDNQPHKCISEFLIAAIRSCNKIEKKSPRKFETCWMKTHSRALPRVHLIYENILRSYTCMALCTMREFKDCLKNSTRFFPEIMNLNLLFHVSESCAANVYGLSNRIIVYF